MASEERVAKLPAKLAALMRGEVTHLKVSLAEWAELQRENQRHTFADVRALLDAGDIDKAMMRAGRDLAPFILFTLDDDADFARHFRDVWTMTDTCSQLIGEWRKAWRRAIVLDCAMTAEEKDAFAAQPETLTLYRAFEGKRRATARGLSWTPSIDVANFYAGYRKQSPAIIRERVRRDDVAA